MQRPRPTDVKGVQVELTAFDPNGNIKEIATVTSDSMGQFRKLWVPEVSGEYTIQATFAGSESYWPSYSQTAIGVSEALATPAPTEIPAQSTADMYFAPAVLGIIAAIAIVGVVIILVLKKRP